MTKETFTENSEQQGSEFPYSEADAEAVFDGGKPCLSEELQSAISHIKRTHHYEFIEQMRKLTTLLHRAPATFALIESVGYAIKDIVDKGDRSRMEKLLDTNNMGSQLTMIKEAGDALRAQLTITLLTARIHHLQLKGEDLISHYDPATQKLDWGASP